MNYDFEPSSWTWPFTWEQLKTFKKKKSLIRVCFRKIIGCRRVLWCQQQDRNRGCLGINTRRRHQRTPEPVQEARGQQHGMEVGSTARFPTTEWGAARIPAKAAEERAWECTWLARGCFFQAETAAQLPEPPCAVPATDLSFRTDLLSFRTYPLASSLDPHLAWTYFVTNTQTHLQRDWRSIAINKRIIKLY